MRIRGRSASTQDSITIGFAYSNNVNLGQTQSITLAPNQIKLYSFNPNKSGDYLLYTSNSNGTLADTSLVVTDELYNDAQSNSGVICTSGVKNRNIYALVLSNAYSTITCDFNVIETENVTQLQHQYSGEITESGFTLHTFTAQYAGEYKFRTYGEVDTYIDAFSCPVNDINSFAGLIDYNDDDEMAEYGDYNAGLVVALDAGQTVYIRVRGYNDYCYGDYTFCVTEVAEKATISDWYVAPIDTTTEKWYAFTATESGTYQFCSDGYSDFADTYGELYNHYNI